MKETQKVNGTQALVLLLSVVTALSQSSSDLQALIPPKYAVGVLAVTNILSSVLPKLISTVQSIESGKEN